MNILSTRSHTVFIWQTITWLFSLKESQCVFYFRCIQINTQILGSVDTQHSLTHSDNAKGCVTSTLRLTHKMRRFSLRQTRASKESFTRTRVINKKKLRFDSFCTNNCCSFTTRINSVSFSLFHIFWSLRFKVGFSCRGS